jgi:penicillin-binding protein 1C
MGAILVVAIWARTGPLPDGLLDPARDVSTVVVDRNGEVLYEARSGAGARSAGVGNSTLPPSLVTATLAAEDRRFRWHVGVDPAAILRAAWHNARAGRVVEGGSTISQQVAKLLLSSRGTGANGPRGIRAKVEEAVVALRLEHRLSKDQILALYLSLAPYGNQVAGATRAAQIYFGVEPRMLTPAQAAFLAALPQRPSAYNPYRDRDAALRRQRAILSRMAAQGWLTAQQAEDARIERLRFVPLTAAFRAPHFVEMVLAAHTSPLPPRIQTTLDAGLQADIDGIIRSHRSQLARHSAHNVAIVVLDNRTSEWRAWEGSGDYANADHGGAINGALVPRQPGSALKPFTYALGFETGDTPASVLPDVPASFPTAEPGVVYTPRNYDGSFHGPLRMRKALAGSQNVPAVALASRIGVPDLLQFLRRAGFDTLDKTAAHYGLGLTLGNPEVRLTELVGAYAAFARGGVFIEPRFLQSGNAHRITRRIVSSRAAFWVSDVLSDDDARAYVFGRGGSLEFPFAVATKTGTSQAYRDNWAVGYTRDVTVGVWVGNFDRRPLVGSSGVTGAGPLFHAVMLAAQKRLGGGGSEGMDGIVEPSSELEESTVCELSGMLAGTACPLRRREWLPRTFSARPCDWHHATEAGVLTIWPPEYRHWADRLGLLHDAATRRTAVASVEAVSAASSRADALPHVRRTSRGLEIASPADGSTYLIDPTLRADFQTLSLRAIAAHGPIEWRVNGRLHASVGDGGDAHWPLRPGTHVIRASDGRGQDAEVTIVVK